MPAHLNGLGATELATSQRPRPPQAVALPSPALMPRSAMERTRPMMLITTLGVNCRVRSTEQHGAEQPMATVNAT